MMMILRPGTVKRMKLYEISKLHEPVRMRWFCETYDIDWGDQLYRELVAMVEESKKKTKEEEEYWKEAHKLADELLNDDDTGW